MKDEEEGNCPTATSFMKTIRAVPTAKIVVMMGILGEYPYRKYVRIGGPALKEKVDAKMIASQIISDAFIEATKRGVTADMIASTALTAALGSLVQQHGRATTVRMGERLLDAVRDGKFGSDH